MASGKVYLVIGANRGIGLALVSKIASTPSNIVFASTRDPKSAASSKLSQLAAENKNVHVLSAEVTNLESLFTAAGAVKSLGLSHIDKVIFNAGILPGMQGLVDITKEQFLAAIEVNAFGSILVYQAFSPLFGERDGAKTVFATVSSSVAATGKPWPIGAIAYTTSKAALNHVTAKINLSDNVVALAIHPGMVETDMSTAFAADTGSTPKAVGDAHGVEVLSPQQSAVALLSLVDDPDVETKYAGKYMSYTGDELPL